jgi:hypothetical protein
MFLAPPKALDRGEIVASPALPGRPLEVFAPLEERWGRAFLEVLSQKPHRHPIELAPSFGRVISLGTDAPLVRFIYVSFDA